MTVSIVTPWHDHPELVDDYMAALDIGPWPDELIVVDNGSAPPIAFASGIRLDENRGFCGGANAGLAAATTDIVVFLNNDIATGQPGWLATLTDAVEPGVLAGARLRTDHHAHVDGQPMPYLDGWCLAGTRDDLLDLGGFDETLAEPAYYSDNLLCLEARAAGMTLREVPGLGLRHKTGTTTRDHREQATLATRANHQRYLERARQLLSPVAL